MTPNETPPEELRTEIYFPLKGCVRSFPVRRAATVPQSVATSGN